MAQKSEPAAKTRLPLSRGRVLAAALAIADEGGLDAVTMRRIGERLGVEAMSLYKHVVDKDDILDGIVDLVIGEIELPDPDTDWRTGMRVRAASARRVLNRHPWAIGMMESRTSLGPNALRYVDAVIGSLRASGFSVRMAAHAFVLLDSFVYGLVVQETGMAIGDGEPPIGVEPSIDDQFSHLAEVVNSHTNGPAYSYDDEFEFGLDLILDGLERSAQRAE